MAKPLSLRHCIALLMSLSVLLSCLAWHATHSRDWRLFVSRPPSIARRETNLPYCDYSAGLLTDSFKNFGAGLDHRKTELGVMAEMAVWTRRALVNFKPLFAWKHDTQPESDGPKGTGFHKWWWSEIIDMDNIVVRVEDSCGESRNDYTCRLRVAEDEDTRDVRRVPRRKSKASWFCRSNDPEDTPPECFKASTQFQWSPTVIAERDAILRQLGRDAVVMLLRMGDLADKVPEEGGSRTRRELNDPAFIVKALARHNITAPRKLYLSSNPNTHFDTSPFTQAGFSVTLSPTLRGAGDNMFRFAVERAVAESPLVWTVVTSKPPGKEGRTITLCRE